MHWQYSSKEYPTSLAQLTQVLLNNRGISDVELFFHPPHPETISVADLGFDVEEMARAVSYIHEACRQKKDIVIFGDYDADGISATATLWEALADLGCTARPFIPHREKHGYGLTVAALQEIITEKKPDLLITVDNAIVAHAAAQYAAENDVPLIITDHHQAEKDARGQSYYPKAVAVVHTTKLCGTTVAWILARELGATHVAKSLDLCGLATISDQVPLQGANRSFAFHGIKALQQSHRLGLRALYTEAKITQANIDSFTVGYLISPRINAMGRLAHGMDALRLLCTQNMGRAAQLASTLASMNVERQDMTQSQLDLAVAQVQKQEMESIVIAVSDEFHEGVIGLIAGKLVERFSKPALVMSVSERSIKGSARSLPGINITELLRSVRQHLQEVGGHPMAGGFSLNHEQLEQFKVAIFTQARTTISQELLVPSITVDCKIPLSLVNQELCVLLDKFAPFGSGNAKPLFSFTNLRVVGSQLLGKEKQHLKLLLESLDFSTSPIEALFWRQAKLIDGCSVGQQLDCVGQVECSTWNGKTKVQMILKDITASIVAVDEKE